MIAQLVRGDEEQDSAAAHRHPGAARILPEWRHVLPVDGAGRSKPLAAAAMAP